MTIASFDALLAQARADSGQQRLLVVLLRRSAAEGDGDAGGGTVEPVMASDFVLDDAMSLGSLVADADQAGQPWDLLMAATLTGTQGGLPSRDDAQPYLKRMATAVMTGEGLDAYAVFDRQGRPVQLAPQARTDPAR